MFLFVESPNQIQILQKNIQYLPRFVHHRICRPLCYLICVNVFQIDGNMKFMHQVDVSGNMSLDLLLGELKTTVRLLPSCLVTITIPFVSFARAHFISLVLCHCACSPYNKDHLHLLLLSKATLKIGGGHAKVCTVINMQHLTLFVSALCLINTDLSLSLSFSLPLLQFLSKNFSHICFINGAL